MQGLQEKFCKARQDCLRARGHAVTSMSDDQQPEFRSLRSHSLLLIIEIPTVIGKFRTAIKASLFYFNLCLSVMLDGLSCSYPFLLMLHEFVLALETLMD
jgi:hypothetical protein